MELKPPDFSDSKPHLFADQVEVFLAYFSTVDCLSISDIKSLVDRDSESIIGTGNDSEEEIYDIERLEPEEADIVIDSKSNTCFDHLRFRFETLGEFYPFVFDENENICRPIQYTDKQNFYLFLLKCSSLNLFNKSDSLKLAEKFEIVCANVLSNWIPNSDVKQFGPTSNDRKDFFGPDTKDALVTLAKFLHAIPSKEIIFKKRRDDSYQVNRAGDKGLDLVAKMPFHNDGATGAVAILGQCASRKEHWWHKKHEADPIEFHSYMSFHNSPLNMVFIPVCFRDSDGSWYDEGKSSGCCLVDRLRLCSMLNNYSGNYNFLPE